MRPRVVGLSGHARSGKSTAAECLRDSFGATVFMNSEPIGQIIAKLGWSRHRQSYAKLSTILFDVLGRDLLAHYWIRATETNSIGDLFVIDGIRYPEEIKVYREMTDFLLIGIVSSDKLRFDRALSADDCEKDRKKTYMEFLESKASINEIHVDDIVHLSDAKIYNNGSINEFYTDIILAIKEFYP